MTNKVLKNPVPPYWKLKGEKVWAGGAFAFADRIYYGDLIDKSVGSVWGDSILWSDSLFKAESGHPLVRRSCGRTPGSRRRGETLDGQHSVDGQHPVVRQHHVVDSIMWSDSITLVDNASAFNGDD